MSDRLKELQWEIKAKESYRALFTQGGERTVHGSTVLDDLRHFCKIDALGFGDNPAEHAKILGRMEVFNVIMARIRIDSDKEEGILAEIKQLTQEVKNVQ